MLSVVTFKWHAPRYRTQFSSHAVNVLRNMVERHCRLPFRFFCVTDDSTGLDPRIQSVKLWDDHANLKNLSVRDGPSCYRRLKLFSAEAASIFGERLVQLDLDTVIVRDITPLWDRDEDFVAWGDTAPKTHYNGSMFLLRTGSRTHIWDDFHPIDSPVAARSRGFLGSDQAWLSYALGPNEAKWGVPDGVYSWRVHIEPRQGQLPEDARIVMFHGVAKPWDQHVRGRVSWIDQHWR